MYIRTADPNDLAAVETLLGRAYPVLMAASYDTDILAAALPVMIKANPELLGSGTFYVAEESGRIVGCGGWTFEQPGSGRVEDGLAHLRHFATDPDMARHGIGRSIFERCAALAAQRGARIFQAFAGLNAEPFYQSLGLRRRELREIPLGPTAKLQAVLMEGPIPRT
jgi:N-acetylglutamate synthase-like GNAT family acetyltransferase